jgi:UDP-glucose 4-epimerase
VQVLITGSSGQIGTNLALRLLAEGHRVFGVDKRPNQWTDEFRYVIQDLSAPYRDFKDGVGSVPYPRPDVVIHLAANAKVHELVEHPHRALENITLTYNVLEYCRAQHVPIIFSSSREVYGDIHRYLTEEGHADFVYTESPYSASKIGGEAFIYSYARCYNLPYLVFRFSNVYGRYDSDIERMERVIPLFINRMRQGQPVTVFGREKTLDFTYVDDCVEGIVRGMERLVAGTVVNQTINLAYGEGNTLVRMAELIAESLQVEATINVEPSKLPGEVTHYVANIGRARQLLGYTPQVALAEGLRRAVAWNLEWDASRGGKS